MSPTDSKITTNEPADEGSTIHPQRDYTTMMLRRSILRPWQAALPILFVSLAMGTVSPSPETVVSDRASDNIKSDLTAGKLSDAMERAETLLSDTNFKLLKQETRLIPVGTWLDEQLDLTTRIRFAEQFEKRNGAAAQQALADAVRAGDVTAIFNVRDRFPWTKAAQRAPTEAAKVLAGLGDARNARAIAKRAGGAEVSSFLQFPDEKPSLQAAFAPAWYSAVFPDEGSKVVPVGTAEVAFIASPTAMAAVNKAGKVLWTQGAPLTPWSPPPVAKPETMKPIPAPEDNSLIQPALWTDLTGTPQVVVARQTTWDTSVLRAVRAGDGATLWDTSSIEPAGKLFVIGAPAVAGRYVYTLALNLDAAAGARMQLLGLELTSGRVLVRSDLGESSPPDARLTKRHDVKLLSSATILIGDQVLQSDAALCVDDARAYASFTGGTVFAVDRFSGAIQWVNTYAPKYADRAAKEKDRRNRTQTPVKRWRDLPASDGNIVVVAPIDTDSVFAYDAATGKQKWEQSSVRDLELVGIADGKALFAGARLAALKLDTGEVAWQQPIEGKPTGPGFIEKDAIGMMTDRGPALFAIDSGAAIPRREPESPVMESILKTAATRQGLQETGLLDALKISLAAPPEEKPVKPVPPKKPGDKEKKPPVPEKK
jgi:outer membrane protein assembly factor BamB